MSKYIANQLLCLALLIFAIQVNATLVPITKKDFVKVHQAIFETFLPFEADEIDTTLNHLVQYASQETLTAVKTIPQFKGAFFLLNNLHLLHSELFFTFYYHFLSNDSSDVVDVSSMALAPIRDFLHSLPTKHKRLSIDKLSVEDRFKLFELMIRSPVNLLRFAGFYLRMFYTQSLYGGAVGEKISRYAEPGNIEAGIVPDLPKFSTHLVYNKKKHRLEGQLDAIIVGTGPSGAVAAHEFQAQGLNVLVVEKGAFVIPGAVETKNNPNLLENGGPRVSEDGSIVLLNGEGVGGGTAVNLDMTFAPTIDHVIHRFHQWHAQNLIPADLWTDEELKNAVAWVEEKFEPRIVGDDEVNENNEMVRRGAKALNIPYRLYELNSYKIGTSPHEVTNKKTSFETLLLPAMVAPHNPATLLTNCGVTKVLIKDKSAYGVECIYEPKTSSLGVVTDLYGFNIKPKTKIRLRAKNIILAAGNLGTTAILLRSKINNPNIGRGFVVHPFVSLMGKFDHEIRAELGEQSTVLIDHFMPTDAHPKKPGYLIETGLGRLGLWALMVPGTPQQMKRAYSKVDHVGGLSVLLTESPNPNNRIEVKRSGEIVVHYHLLDKDRLNLIDGIKTGAKILFAGGAREVSFNTFESVLFQNDRYKSNTLTPDMDLDEVFSDFELKRNQTSLLGAHMTGGNKIGTDPSNSVLNSKYGSWEIPNLYVIDGGVFPGSVGANPMQTIYTTAKIFTERFLSDVK